MEKKGLGGSYPELTWSTRRTQSSQEQVTQRSLGQEPSRLYKQPLGSARDKECGNLDKQSGGAVKAWCGSLCGSSHRQDREGEWNPNCFLLIWEQQGAVLCWNVSGGHLLQQTGWDRIPGRGASSFPGWCMYLNELPKEWQVRSKLQLWRTPESRSPLRAWGKRVCKVCTGE